MTYATVLSDNTKVEITYIARTPEGRRQYQWTVLDQDHHTVIAESRDLFGPVYLHKSEKEMLIVFADFISAWVEAWNSVYSDNRDLFHESLLDWAQRNVDELLIGPEIYKEL